MHIHFEKRQDRGRACTKTDSREEKYVEFPNPSYFSLQATRKVFGDYGLLCLCSFSFLDGYIFRLFFLFFFFYFGKDKIFILVALQHFICRELDAGSNFESCA